jgi:hypothetical protein
MERKSRHQPFKTPDGYFEDFELRLKQKIATEDIPLPKNSGFRVPRGYFEELSKTLEKPLEGPVKVIPLMPYRRYALVAASAVILILLAIGLGKNAQKEITFADLANNDIESYWENNDLGLSSYELAEFLPLDNMANNTIEEHTISEEQMLQYLTDHIEDVNELNLENDE